MAATPTPALAVPYAAPMLPRISARVAPYVVRGSGQFDDDTAAAGCGQVYVAKTYSKAEKGGEGRAHVNVLRHG